MSVILGQAETAYQCTRGHRWTLPPHYVGNDSLFLFVTSTGGQGKTFCLRCLIERLTELCGEVTLVAEKLTEEPPHERPPA